MPRVQLIVTGDLERVALADALGRLFPDVDFEPPQKVNGTTTTALPALGSGRVASPMNRMARALVEALRFGRKGKAADFVVAVDDLELANLAQPQVVVGWAHRAVNEYIQGLQLSQNTEARLRTTVKQCASFHLFVPMTETYFFGDPAALSLCGVATASLAPGQPLESFAI